VLGLRLTVALLLLVPTWAAFTSTSALGQAEPTTTTELPSTTTTTAPPSSTSTVVGSPCSTDAECLQVSARESVRSRSTLMLGLWLCVFLLAACLGVLATKL
jgi:hypothetical protein